MFRLKKASAFIAVFLLMFTLALPPSSQAASITITIYFGKPPSCEGWGFCRITIGWQVAAENPKSGERSKAIRKCRASASVRENKLYLDLTSTLPERESVVPLSENMELDAATSKGLGFKSVRILKGDYKIDYAKNKFGSIVLNVETRN